MSLYNLASGELKKENNKLKQEIDKLVDTNEDINREFSRYKYESKKEIERLNKELEEIKSKDVYEELLELRGRVFKAIDYIKFHFNDMVANVLIDILKGSDK